ncbi:tRNA uridine-5-carboxymethylaminomethyl(34) synthesis GTPase MnmE [Leptolyngbya sp. CCY15150]|uniref:tRNA uridine-5-carboxymethylaminomethyl(34) synthesis GTPase MnmE n=1 Tax=Leptolyngbya sp. CCY15150 TaxID=2767772 RepID=UPI00194F0B81|nr:tRNA uridine-5-carboxymethylaminomethyl(34) synthesis GTPase MnmE [Leptolyngbya sp. CCY15150]
MAASLSHHETIAAIATAIAPEQGSVGIVRLSGDQSQAIAHRLVQTPGHQAWESHRILYGYIRDPHTQAIVDEALVLLMLAPRSYTREDVVELHCHGGIMVVQRVLQLCIEAGARLAEPGEFTLRAFLNGRIDLTQAESITDLVGARSPQAAQTALAGLRGKLAQPIRRLRQQCLSILAEVEARIDFADDLPPLDDAEIQRQLDDLVQQVQKVLDTAERGILMRTGLKVAIVGRPNVGKSSLLNAWSQSDRAIVTDLPGTTRDVVESQLTVRGIPVQVLDTAGIREASDQVEQLGIERSRRAAEAADLILFTIDAQSGWTSDDQIIYDQVSDRPLILIMNKVDLADAVDPTSLPSVSHIVRTAAAYHQGIEALEDAILDCIHAKTLTAANQDFAINQRQAIALTRAKSALLQVQQTTQEQLPLDFWTIDLRQAIQSLGEITGEEMVESVLDEIFSRFCIGK